MDWVALKTQNGQFILVRKSVSALGEVEAYSEDGGRNPLMKPTEAEVRSSLRTNGATDTVISGNYYLKMCANAGLDNPEHWIYRAKKLLLAPTQTPTPTPTQTPTPTAAPVTVRDRIWYAPFQTGTPARDYSVSILNDIVEIPVPEHNNFPDGVNVSVPNASGTGWILIHPEQINYRSAGSSALYEDYPVSSFKPIASLGIPGRALTWPGLGREMAVWLFGLLKVPTEQGLYLGCLHAELHRIQTAPPCFKALMIAQSRDEGQTFTQPQTIISYPSFSPQLDGTWAGTGDPSFVYHEAEKRYLAYFYSAQNRDRRGNNGIGIACSTDPQARAGTWKLLKDGRFSVDALSNQTFDVLPWAGGNPHVFWNQTIGKFVMLVGEWNQNRALTFSTSVNGVQWDAPKRIPFDCEKGWTPLYPSIVSRELGSWGMGSATAKLYYADSRTPGVRKMMSRTIRITSV